MEDSNWRSWLNSAFQRIKRRTWPNERVLLVVICAALVILTAFAVYVQDSVVVSVEVNGEQQNVVTDANTVGELLQDMGIVHKAEDKVSHSLQTKLEPDMSITWQKAFQVTFDLYGENEQLWTTAQTVEQLIEELNIVLKEGDVIIPGKHSGIKHGLVVEVAHFATEQEEEEFKVGFETIKEEDPTIEEGEERVLSSGTEGKGVNQYKVTYKNGEEIERELIERKEIQKREDRLIAVGTKPVPEPEPKKATAALAASEKESAAEDSSATETNESASSDSTGSETNESASSDSTGSETNESASSDSTGSETNESASSDSTGSETKKSASSDSTGSETNESASSDSTGSETKKSASSDSSGSSNSAEEKSDEGAQEFQVQSTAYSAECSGCSGVTATGIDLNANPDKKVIAVDPSVIPLGSKVEVEGYGTAIAGDTGGAIQGKKIDVFFPDSADAEAWGRKSVTVRILNE